MRSPIRTLLAGCVPVALLVLTAPPARAATEHEIHGVPLWSMVPFLGILLSIAVVPLLAHHWWERNRNKAIVAALFGVPAAIWLLVSYRAAGASLLGEAIFDFISFMTLIGSLYFIAGGIYIRGSLSGSPLGNTTILGIGAVLANVIGTTGAAMLLIRPLLRANKARHHKVHIVVFFILIVCNCGGLLTPLGDPPLFMGFVKGVPFAWSFRLWPIWLVMNGSLLVMFNLADQWMLSRGEREGPEPLLEIALEHEPVRIEGWVNVPILAGVVLAILGRGYGWGNGGVTWPFGIQEGALCVLAALSYFLTPRRVHKANDFAFEPVVEVAVLFAGIFVTMVAPILILNDRGPSLGLHAPWHYFWLTGSLSSVLDNTPTYLTFSAAVASQVHVNATIPGYLGQVVAGGSYGAHLLAAVSAGAVLMGANTYLGNGPNFMAKAIAEYQGVRMPSFFGYMFYALLILVPLYLVVTFVFL